MAKILNFYIDDSGTRHPDRATTTAHADRDWFALGGILLRESDEYRARKMYEIFCETWQLDYPLHSAGIRNRAGQFQWLRSLPEKDYAAFMRQLEKLLLALPVLGLACVIDRPGYNSRYMEKYGRRRWSLCKTAFSIVVERAAKYAAKQKLKLRVMVERSSKKDDAKLESYYKSLKEKAAPFDPGTSAKYAPMDPVDFEYVLYEFKTKNKSSPMMQVADMYLWPMCMGGYDRTNHPYRTLIKHSKLLDMYCDDPAVEGVKYSCFDLVKPKT
jgi:hypothetical protein